MFSGLLAAAAMGVIAISGFRDDASTSAAASCGAPSAVGVLAVAVAGVAVAAVQARTRRPRRLPRAARRPGVRPGGNVADASTPSGRRRRPRRRREHARWPAHPDGPVRPRPRPEPQRRCRRARRRLGGRRVGRHHPPVRRPRPAHRESTAWSTSAPSPRSRHPSRPRETVGDLRDTLVANDSNWLVPLIQSRLDTGIRRADQAAHQAEATAAAARLGPDILGADGERRYLLAFVNNAEARGTSGLMGNWSELTVDNGRLEVTARTGAPPTSRVPRLYDFPATRHGQRRVLRALHPYGAGAQRDGTSAASTGATPPSPPTCPAWAA
jgi:hypothetical protein